MTSDGERTPGDDLPERNPEIINDPSGGISFIIFLVAVAAIYLLYFAR